MLNMDDLLTGTVKGPGLLPHEYLFITRDNDRTRIGEFVYYEARIGDERRQIVGSINSRKLVRNLPCSSILHELSRIVPNQSDRKSQAIRFDTPQRIPTNQ